MLVRPANVSDIPMIAAVQVETWRAAYRGQMPDAVLDGLDVERNTSSWREEFGKPASLFLVAEEAEAVVGFCYLVPTRDNDADPKTTAEIVAIYVLPRHWRQGAGRALANYALAAARQRGYQTLTLWALASNSSAKCFYESMRFCPDGAAKTFKMKDGTELQEVRFRITL